jgi:hypothetical protein
MVTAVRKKISKPKVSAYDVAEHLRTPEEMAAYLDAWLEDAPDDVCQPHQPQHRAAPARCSRWLAWS